MDKELEAGTISGAEARQDSFPPLDEHKQAAVHMTPDSDENTDRVDETAQAGVQAIEATTVVWSKRSLIVAYVMIWLIYFVDSLQQGATIQLGPYVTSSFYQHSLTAATGIMSNIIGGVSKLTIAKILDIWGRPQGYAISIVILTLGLIMMAACNGVELYAAAQVFYWVGYVDASYTGHGELPFQNRCPSDPTPARHVMSATRRIALTQMHRRTVRGIRVWSTWPKRPASLSLNDRIWLTLFPSSPLLQSDITASATRCPSSLRTRRS